LNSDFCTKIYKPRPTVFDVPHSRATLWLGGPELFRLKFFGQPVALSPIRDSGFVAIKLRSCGLAPRLSSQIILRWEASRWRAIQTGDDTPY
jgi:hypothetical protein